MKAYRRRFRLTHKMLLAVSLTGPRHTGIEAILRDRVQEGFDLSLSHTDAQLRRLLAPHIEVESDLPKKGVILSEELNTDLQEIAAHMRCGVGPIIRLMISLSLRNRAKQAA